MNKTIKKELLLLEDLGMIYPKNTSSQKFRYGLYKCFCGKEFKTQIRNVKKCLTKSCGCIKNELKAMNSSGHKLSKHRLYIVWRNMIARCTNPKHKSYKDYGEIGITICNKWLDINNFINDMDSSFKDGLKIDRIDNSKGYYKENCRWVTQSIQSQNTRLLKSTNKSGFRGVSKNKNKYQASIGINRKTIYLGLFDTAIEAAKVRDKYIIDNNLEHTRNF